MIHKMPNPFKDDWERFDIEGFKEDLCHLVDRMMEEEEADVVETLEEVDDMMMQLSVILKFKGKDYVEAVRIGDIPKERLEELGIPAEEIDPDAYIPLTDDLYEVLMDEPKPNPKKNSNGWLI